MGTRLGITKGCVLGVTVTIWMGSRQKSSHWWDYCNRRWTNLEWRLRWQREGWPFSVWDSQGTPSCSSCACREPRGSSVRIQQQWIRQLQLFIMSFIYFCSDRSGYQTIMYLMDSVVRRRYIHYKNRFWSHWTSAISARLLCIFINAIGNKNHGVISLDKFNIQFTEPVKLVLHKKGVGTPSLLRAQRSQSSLLLTRN